MTARRLIIGPSAVKLYASEKTPTGEGSWRHERVTLRPDSTDPSHQPLVFDATTDGELRIVAELVEIVG